MELKLFTDLIDALGKVGGGLRAIVNLPKAEREAMRRTLDETYSLIDTTLNMVIIRLGDIQLHTSDDDLPREVTRLDNCKEWMPAEREFRLCRSPHVALRETETLTGRPTFTVSTKDWRVLLQQMQNILATEGEVGLFIALQFQQLGAAARSAYRYALAAVRSAFIGERREFISQEPTVYNVV